ncbi:hypothetical protein MWU59_02400 [Flavobacteriaceae bacterium F08102]|nr:hypothetical protein [Flavobacteriaceae bacterium F08102]
MKFQPIVTTHILFITLCGTIMQAQHIIHGEILDATSLKPISNVHLHIEGNPTYFTTKRTGKFSIPSEKSIVYLIVSHPHYIKRTFQISLDRRILNLGIIVLYPSRDIFEEPIHDIPIGKSNLLSRYLRFYSSSMPFHLRGTNQKKWSLENMTMNHLMDGKIHRETWKGLSGLLNTSTQRQSQNSFEQMPSTFGFTNKPKGFVIKGGLNNLTYSGAFELTLNHHTTSKKWKNLLYFSRRWAKEGYFEGCLYDAWAIGGLTEYQFNLKNTLSAAIFYAPLRAGSHAPLTERVYKQMGTNYNPLWGMQLSLQRNSHISNSRMPLFFTKYSFHPNRWKITGRLMVQFGERSNSRLDYQDAENPFPNYWAKQGSIKSAPQIDWSTLYWINQNQTNSTHKGASKYMVYEEVQKAKSVSANLDLEHKLGKNSTWASALFIKTSNDFNFAKPIDLLAASYYYDVNEFYLINGVPAENQVGNSIKKLGDKIKYNYQRHAFLLRFQNEFHYASKIFKATLKTTIAKNSFYRKGLFLNQAFPENSLGKSAHPQFTPYSISTHWTFHFRPKHQFNIQGIIKNEAPFFENSYVNAREHNTTLPHLTTNKKISLEASYTFKSSSLHTQLTGYWARSTKETAVESFFADGGIGANYFNVITTGLDRKNKGIEWSLHHQFHPNLYTHLALALGEHTYGSNPNISVTYNPNALENNTLEPFLFKDLGAAYIKNYRQSTGPQQLYGIALGYKKRFFNFQLAATYYTNHYINISVLRRTSAFFFNPLTHGQPFEDIDESLAKNLLKQTQLPKCLLLNTSISKWWKTKDIGFGLSIKLNNALNSKYKITGYEQHRLASYSSLREDTALGDKRNFGPKYQFGIGRNLGIQLTVKLY